MNSYLVYAEMKIAPLKQIFETLKDQVAKIPMEFIKENKDKSNDDPNIDNFGGIKIHVLGNTKALVIICKLMSDEMDEFYVAENLLIQFDIQSVYKFIKSLEKKSAGIKIFIHKTSQDKITFDVGYAKHIQNLIRNPPQHNTPASIDFEIQTIIKAKQLKTTCARMSNYGDVICIMCTQNELTFKYVGDDSSGMDVYSTTATDEDSRVTIKFCKKLDAEYIYKGNFNVKNMSIFGKSASLSEDIILTFKTGFLMFVTYTVGSAGIMTCGIAPHGQPDNKIKHKSISMVPKS